MGEEMEERITDLLGANKELHLERLFGQDEEVKTARVKKREVKAQAGEEEKTVDQKQAEEKVPEQDEGEVFELPEENVQQVAATGRKEVAPEFFTQKSISGPRPIPVPCSYRLCVANHNTRHTADR